YEIMNEPIGVDDTVQAFQMRAARTLRDADPKKLIVFEPVATRNFTNGAPISPTPFPVAGAVYAVHIYTGVFSERTWYTNGTYVPSLTSSIQGARQEADAWGTPLMVTEYGLGSDDHVRAPAWVNHAHDAFDAVAASTTYWIWKDPDNGSWGLFDRL